MKFAIAAAAAVFALPGLASAAQVWKISSDVGGAMYEETCTLDVADGKIDGQCVAEQVPAPMKTQGTYAAVNGVTHAEFSHDVTVNDQPLHVVFKGDQQPDGGFKGVIEAAGTTGTFTAVQQN